MAQGLKRGDFLKAVFSRELGKPRPALVVQSDTVGRLSSVLLCPLTTDLKTVGPLRIPVRADDGTGLKADSLVMVDKLAAVPLERCREVFGHIEERDLERVDGLLFALLGFND